MKSLSKIASEIIACTACPRLREHCLLIAKEKRRAFTNETYWGKPVPGFGDPLARVHIVGLAPAAHGANRTGRMFTGDESGKWLYKVLFDNGFATLPESVHHTDKLQLEDAFISAAARCAPPQNKPTPQELLNCEHFLRDEISALPNVQVYIALGQIALSKLWPIISTFGPPAVRVGKRPPFKHGAVIDLPGLNRKLILSYHPSQQNTFTKKLTWPMWDQIFKTARKITNYR